MLVFARRLCCAGLILSLAASPALAEDDSLFVEGRAQAALEQVFAKANHPTRVLDLELRDRELQVEAQDPTSPRHIDSWRLAIPTRAIVRWVIGDLISGPRPVEANLIHGDLDANLFELSPADLVVVPRLIAAAIKRAALEDPATSVHLTLRRPLRLLPQPSSGPPEWDIELSSGRERASIYADMSGRLTHVNLDGTHRAQLINYLAGGKDLVEAAALAGSVLGSEPTIRRVVVYNRYLSLEALNPDHPERYARFSTGINGVFRDLDDTTANIVFPRSEPPGRFAMGDVDWSLLPALEDKARERLQLPGGRVGLVIVSKPGTAAAAPIVEWEINIKAANDPAVEGYVVFDNAGNLLRTKFPPGRAPKLDLFEPAAAAGAFAALARTLGEHAAAVELRFDTDRMLATVRDPKDAKAQTVLEYEGEALSRSILSPLDWPTFGPDWFFDLSEAVPMAGRWADLQRETLSRLGLSDGKIERITISKEKLMMPNNNKVLIEIRAAVGKRQGRVVYDSAGRMVDIVTP